MSLFWNRLTAFQQQLALINPIFLENVKMSDNAQIVDGSAKRVHVKAGEFVKVLCEVHKRGGTYEDVAGIIGVATDSVKQRRLTLNAKSRKAGKPLNLPSLQGGDSRRIDFDALNNISKSLLEC